ncbi:hypothetical protein LY13_002424 [Prauserella aidingensis]|uniref:hypothetical protein n=1 Tax=Prauserella aidingensis TaxID=387890 RepID=UPI0020A6125A|nr:hypothetical protein [Prauserella aidingensis]MCP2253670.1 hypothetical protein [Prauserella aidingensis]
MTVLRKPFTLAVLVAVALAGWAAVSGGLFDGAVASRLRASSVYAAPDYDLDRYAAERVIGNRKLTVAFLSPDDDASEVCDDVAGAADGTLFVAMTREGDEWSPYGCSHHTDDIGTGVVAESVISRGTDTFADRPVEALKVMVVNFDQLVRSGHVPDGARTIDPPLPRYLLAGALLGAVVLGSAIAYAVARAIGRRAATRRIDAETGDDARSVLNAETGAVSRALIELDRTYTRAVGGTSTAQQNFVTRYRHLVDEYVALTRDVAAAGDEDVDALVERARELHRTATELQETPSAPV